MMFDRGVAKHQRVLVKAEIQHRLGTPVILENDANCAALGEKWIGAGREAESICMVTPWTGVGGGFIFHGKLWHGMIGMAGEIGHMTVAPDGPPCACGKTSKRKKFFKRSSFRNPPL